MSKAACKWYTKNYKRAISQNRVSKYRYILLCKPTVNIGTKRQLTQRNRMTDKIDRQTNQGSVRNVNKGHRVTLDESCHFLYNTVNIAKPERAN